jgi:amino acid adenylation domain-containing protein/non-ribosomal peptide synthase protein (TIGR01720 family)
VRTKFDLTWTVEERPTAPRVRVRYRSALYDGVTARRMIAQLGRLLEAAAAAPRAPLGSLSLLAPAERHQLVVEWSDTARPAADDTVHGRLARVARQRPDAVALTARGESLTFGALLARVDALAAVLAEHRVRPEEPVAVSVVRSTDSLVALFAVLRAGGAYLPIDPEQPIDYLSAVLADAPARLVIGGPELAPLADRAGVERISPRAVTATPPPPDRATADRLAYVLYTSGSTGRQKGVMVRHGAVLDLLSALGEIGRVEAGERVGVNAPFTFDASVKQWVRLLAGAELVLVDAATRLDGAAMLDWLDRHRLALVDVTPAQLRLLLQAGMGGPRSRRGGPRAVLVGGEAIDEELWRQLAAVTESRAWGSRFWNVYGPTECTVDATATPILPGTRPLLGRPIEGVGARVVDRRMNPAPLGVPGELVLSGRGLARGYLDAPATTAERFVPAPWGPPGARCYRTGDLARHVHDGQLEFLGRVDRQLKVRGFRIEAGMVEAVLAAHPRVAEAAVAVRRGRLVAYLVTTDGGPGPVELRDWVADRLPSYMVPAASVHLGRLPLTANGKLDVAALPEPSVQRDDLALEYVAPSSDLEASVAAAWSRALGIDRVGLEDNFFDLGGDSITSIQVVARLAEEGLVASPADLFRHQTVASLARAVTSTRQRAAEQGLVDGPVPPTPILRRFFALDAPRPDQYSIGVTLRLALPVATEELASALERLVRHHDALRLRARPGEGPESGWRIDHGAPYRPPVARLELSDVDDPELRRRTLDAARDDLHRSFDLAHGRLFAALSHPAEDGDGERLLLAAHHLAMDGLSWRVLIEHLEHLLTRGPRAELPAKTSSFKAWAETLDAAGAASVDDDERRLWRAQTPADAPRLPRPDGVDVAGASDPGLRRDTETLEVRLDRETTARLATVVPRALRTRMSEALLAALAAALAPWTGDRRLHVDVETHGRPDDRFPKLDLGRTVGWLTSVHPLLLDPGPADADPLHRLRAVKEQMRRIPDEGVGWGLLRWGDEGAEWAARSQPEVAFNHLGRLDPPTSERLLAPTAEPVGQEQAGDTPRRHLLEVGTRVVDGELVASWIFAPRVHGRDEIAARAEEFLARVVELVEHASAPEAGGWTPSDFPLAEIGQERLDRLAETVEIEDLYPLSPLQEGLLFHALYAPSSDLYHSQLTFTLSGQLDHGAFRDAWQTVLDRHPFLRTSLVWEGVDRPHQVVHRQVELPWRELDLRRLGAAEREARLAEVARADRAERFDPAEVPLLRIHLVRIADDEHVCLWSHHHLLMDGWTLALALEEVFHLYEARIDGHAPSLASPPPYREYVAWLGRQDPEATERYWRRTLAGFTSPNHLPIIELAVGAPDAAPDADPDVTSVALSKKATAALERFGQRHRLTTNTLVHGAWALLLERYTGDADVVFGTTVSGRPASLPEVESMLGLFINSLPVRVEIDPAAELVAWLGRLQEHEAELRRYEHSPLVDVQSWSDIPRGEQLFETLLVLESYPHDESLRQGSAASGRLGLGGFASFEKTNYPLSLMIVPGRRLELEAITDPSRVDRRAVEALLGHLETLLRALPESAGARLGELPVLNEAERTRIIAGWNPDPRAVHDRRSFPQRVAEHALERPDAVAVVDGARQVTYGELRRRVARLAREIAAAGPVADRPVGLCAGRGIERVVGLLAIQEAGGAYLPLDPDYPAERLSYMVEDSGARVLVVEPRFRDRVATQDNGATVVDLVSDAPVDETAPEGLEIDLDRLAYVIYTSGSTGRPKGVMLHHRGLANLVEAQERVFDLTADDRVLQFASLSFDAAVFEIAMALWNGAALHLAPRGELLPGPDLARTLARRRITRITVPPSALAAMGSAEAADLSELTAVVVAGEACPPDVVDGWGAERAFYDAYGPTEATVWTTTARCLPGGGKPPIGVPIDGTRVFVLDRQLRLVPPGVPGQLHIGGVSLARGYLGRPALTAERFVPDPYSQVAGARLYQSGDLARHLDDGNLDFLGRIDHQVKVRGHRIELGEVEAALAGAPGVREVAVVAWGERLDEVRLVAYLLATDDTSRPEPADLRARLEESLPAYMVPSLFVVLDELPRTPNGKLDRQALPAPEAVAGGARERLAPRTPLERRLAELWADVLDVAEPGVEDDFFHLGGHSLLALRLVTRVREATGLDLALKDLFDAPTIAGMAARLERIERERGAEGLAVQLPTLEPRPDLAHEPFPLNEIQQAYWIGRHSDFELGNVATHAYLELESDDLDVERFEAAWNRLVERHGMLRAVIDADGRQRILPEVPRYRVPVAELADLDQAERESRLEAIRQEMSHQMLSVDEWPLFDFRASRLSAGRVRLHLSFDALVADVWSGQLMFRELVWSYRDLDHPLPPLEITFRDYLMAERSLAETALHERSLTYWRGRLDTLPPAPELPLARAAGSVESPQFTRRSGSLAPERWSRLKARATAAGLTPSGLLLAVYAEVLGAWSKGERFTLNLTLFDRLPLHPQVESILGDFTLLLLLEADVGGGGGFESRARRLQHQLWEDLDHRYVSGVRVLRELAARHGSVPSMPVVFTSVLGVAGDALDSDPMSDLGEVAYAVTQTPQVWIDHGVSERDGALEYKWDVVEELFPPGLVDDLTAAHRELLERLVDDDAAWAADPSVAAPVAHLEERRAVNETAAPQVPATLLELVDGSWAAHRDRPAVTAGGESLTYGELHAVAARLGEELAAAGARPETLVAVVLPKGWQQVAAVLGVLASGAAYLPLDPGLPEERLHQLLAAGRVEHAVTSPALDRSLAWPEGIARHTVRRAEPLASPGPLAPPSVDPETLAYVIFTSGSTGVPKGVTIDHRGAANTVADINRRFAVGPDDRVLALSALSFDLSVWDVFGLLAAGGTLVVPEPDELRDPARWLERVREHRVTVWNSVPALFELFVELLESRGEAPPESLRLALLSGDWIPVSLPARVRAATTGDAEVELVSLGGATEASIWSIWHPIGELDPELPSIPYGRPLDHQSFHVLDGRGAPSPVWVPGELHIGGVGVARCYWSDPVRTAQSFVPHPDSGERLYKTGDLGRYLPGGDIEFLGRLDTQVKIRGYRIELGEVAAAVERHPRVARAVAMAPGTGGLRRLVAYAAPEEGVPPTAEEIQSFVATQLPDYMVPSAVVLLDQLPLTANGKVDRRALPPVGSAAEPQAADGAAGPAAASPEAERLAALVAEVIGRESVAFDADLLELGVTSVEIIRIANRLEEALGFRPPIVRFYENPTVAGLVALEAAEAASSSSGTDSRRHARARTETTEGPAPAARRDYRPIVDPDEREAFKGRRPGVRRDEASRPSVALDGDGAPPELSARAEARRSHREFSDRPIPLADLGRWLGCLRRVELDGHDKYLYPSAGGLYPVQTYLHVVDGRVDGLPGGLYYHHPLDHRLVAVAEGVRLDPALHEPLVNRPIFERSALSVFLIGRLSAIAPMYGDAALSFATLEAGAVTQLLMTDAPAAGLGLCPIGGLDFDAVRPLLDLEPDDVLLHSLVGGALPVDLWDDWGDGAGEDDDFEEGEL